MSARVLGVRWGNDTQ
uniref:Uncharacterized protein n=1 Tax=Anguilla anguilla TaxID=7936 RepID=A0A0E9UU09_ANGAN